MSKSPSNQHRASRQQTGRDSQKRGRQFEDRVEELYRLLRYTVQHGRLFGGRQVDLFLSRTIGDLSIFRAIECKAGPIRAEDIDSFFAKLRLVRKEYPSALGAIVSETSFTDSVTAHAEQEGIHLVTFRDLQAKLLDGHQYATALIEALDGASQYDPSVYIEQNVGHDLHGDSYPVTTFIEDWLHDPTSQQLTILGDVGTGKTFLTHVLASRLAKRYLTDPIRAPLPVRLDLRNADRQFTLEGLLLSHFAATGLGDVTFDVFRHAVSHGNVVLIFDGFDEMSARVSPRVTERNFHELVRVVEGDAKVLLTCRTHYFRSRTEEEEVILGGSDTLSSESARQLYWDLISRRGFKISYLRPFDVKQVETYVSRIKGKQAKGTLKRIRGIYNLMELCQRPLLLDMIVKSIDKITSEEVTAATLYDVFTSAWTHRDKWRDVLAPDDKLEFVKGLARSLWSNQATMIHHSDLTDYVREELASRIQDARQLVEIDSEIRTGSFLVRDDAGNYGFAHKSYREFFLAKYLAEHLKEGDTDSLAIPRISPEVASFLADMLSAGEVESQLEALLTSAYKPLISENALLCLYSIRRGIVAAESTTTEHRVALPVSMQLAGAKLDEIGLEGAELVGANLAEASLEEANLVNVDLRNADCCGAQLNNAQLKGAILDNANLLGAILRDANLEGASVMGADLRSCDLTDAYLVDVRCHQAQIAEIKVFGAIVADDAEAISENDAVLGSALRHALPGAMVAGEELALISGLYPLMKDAARQCALRYGDEVDDIVGEMYLRLSRRIDHLRRVTNMRAFLSRVAHLISRERMRRYSSRQMTALDGLPSDTLEMIEDVRTDNPADAMEHDDERERLSKLMDAMEERFSDATRRAVEEYYLGDRSARDIAAELGMSVSGLLRMFSLVRSFVREYSMQEDL